MNKERERKLKDCRIEVTDINPFIFSCYYPDEIYSRNCLGNNCHKESCIIETKRAATGNGFIIVAFLRTLSINMFILVDITMRSLCPSSYSFSLETSYYLHKEALLVIFKSLLVIIESRPFAEILKKQYLCTSHSL